MPKTHSDDLALFISICACSFQGEKVFFWRRGGRMEPQHKQGVCVRENLLLCVVRRDRCVRIIPFPPLIISPFPLLRSPPTQAIGRLILKEEMKARSGCHDNERVGSRRSSRCGSREALNNLGFGTHNGCESPVQFSDLCCHSNRNIRIKIRSSLIICSGK